jgi:hypothetical protein
MTVAETTSNIGYKKNKMSTDRESGRGNKAAEATKQVGGETKVMTVASHLSRMVAKFI